MSTIAELKNPESAFKKAISNKGSAGIDGMNVEALKMWFGSRCQELQHQLLSGTYQVTAVKEVVIPKLNGGELQLGNPTIKDRLIQ